MARLSQSRAALPLVVVGLTMLSLLPRQVAERAAWLRGPSDVLFGPVRAPARSLVAWLRRDRSGVQGGEEYVRGLESQVEQYRLSYLQARGEVDSLREVVRAISETQKLNASRVRLTVSAVIGTGPDPAGGMYTIQAGQREGVLEGDVVVVNGINVLGRIRRVDPRTSAVLPIFAPSARPVRGVVMLTDDRVGPCCELRAGPGTNGRLVGRMCDSADPTGTGAPPRVAEGMLVRLDDAEWPRSSRMLVIGRIERVEPGAGGRQLVTVFPLAGISGAGEVMVRTEDYASEAPAAAVPANAPKTTTGGPRR